ncbi:hypothetical protein D3C81_2268900 [compost metagenome]
MNKRNKALMTMPIRVFRVTARADIFAASRGCREPKNCDTTMEAPLPITSSTRMAMCR